MRSRPGDAHPSDSGRVVVVDSENYLIYGDGTRCLERPVQVGEQMPNTFEFGECIPEWRSADCAARAGSNSGSNFADFLACSPAVRIPHPRQNAEIRPKAPSGFPGTRDRHIRIGIEPLLFVARGTVLVAGHTEEGKHDHKPQGPAHKAQQNPAETHKWFNLLLATAPPGFNSV